MADYAEVITNRIGDRDASGIGIQTAGVRLVLADHAFKSGKIDVLIAAHCVGQHGAAFGQCDPGIRAANIGDQIIGVSSRQGHTSFFRGAMADFSA